MKFNIWKDYPKMTLPDVLSFIVDNRGKTVPTTENGHILIATNCVRNENLYPSYEKIRFLSEETYQTWFRAHPLPGDILFVCKGTPGRCCLVPDPLDFCIAQDMVALRANQDIIYNYFLLAVLRSREIQLQITNTSVGDVIPHFKKSFFDRIMIPVPPLDIQKIIGNYYMAFSNKIEINKKINENLLEQATALFDNALQQSESISFVELSSLADVKGGKRLPKGVNLISKPNSHPYIRVRNLNNMIFASLSSDYEYVDDETQKSIARYITSAGDVLVSIVGTIGLTAIVDDTLDNANLTENCVKLTNLKGITPEYLLLFLRSKIGIESINKGTVGAVQLKLPIKNIQSIPVPLLMSVEMQALSDILSIMFNRISSNIIETKRLSELRDVLLPKLMSGELGVSDIDL